MSVEVKGPFQYPEFGNISIFMRIGRKMVAPIRYTFGLAIGLFFGAQSPENLSIYFWLFVGILVFAVFWVIISFFARLSLREKFEPLIGPDGRYADYELLFSNSWIAAVKKVGR